ncbi:hypothetical protein D9615_007788 [Tricholomella constricta]|uniref:Uncharacterized protein n=1 Tax=Tricholomella constricta TaxID=117010 RepID=A0A8H5H584_9AGAR|nr:hypothetical protein D9615_007788 [Tricholomella constricta]
MSRYEISQVPTPPPSIPPSAVSLPTQRLRLPLLAPCFITSNIIPALSACEQLRRHAQDWHITALPFVPTQCTHNPLLSALFPISRIWPPDYSIHTITPIPSAALIASYTSNIAPSVAYLAYPLIAYTHLGLPKAFVHLLGPLTSYSTPIAGDHAFFVRSRGLLNAVLCPIVLCHRLRTRPRQLSSTGDINTEEDPP